MNKYFLYALALFTNTLIAQNAIKTETINCFHVENSNGLISPNTNKKLGISDFQNLPFLWDYLTISKEIVYNQNNKIVFEKNEDNIYSYTYNNKGLLQMKISETLETPIIKDTIIYKYNEMDSIAFTYQLPILEKSTYYFDENDRIIPYIKYDYKNKNHTSKTVSRIISEEYEYTFNTNKISNKIKGVYELIDDKSIGKMLEKQSEESFKYYPNGNIERRSYSDKFYFIKSEWNQEETKKTVNIFPNDNSPQYVSIYHYQNGKNIKIEEMSFPYKNYPNGIRSDNSVIEIEYNENDLISKVTYTNLLDSKKIVYNFTYKFNNQNHWIERTVFVDRTAKFIETRNLVYFNN